MNDVGMNLAQRDQGPRLGASFLALISVAERAQKSGAVALDRGFGVVFGEPKIEGFIPIAARGSSQARGKSVDEPGEFAEARSVKNAELALPGAWIRHLFILPERIARARYPRRSRNDTRSSALGLPPNRLVDTPSAD